MVTEVKEREAIIEPESETSPGLFDIARDCQFPCFCQCCLTGKVEDDMSPDPRYCQDCHDFLVKEAEMLSGWRPKWVPKHYKTQQERKIKGEKVIPVKPHTIQPKGIFVTHKTVQTPCKTLCVTKTIEGHAYKGKGRGRPKKELPDGVIEELVGEGLGIRGITRQLKFEGFDVSAMTVSRKLAQHSKGLINEE